MNLYFSDNQNVEQLNYGQVNIMSHNIRPAAFSKLLNPKIIRSNIFNHENCLEEQAPWVRNEFNEMTLSTPSTSTEKNHDSLKRHVCSTCGNRYKFFKNLKRHVTFECNKEKSFACMLCEKTFYHYFQVKNHVTNKHVHKNSHTT